jgi:outer membrane protein
MKVSLVALSLAVAFSARADDTNTTVKSLTIQECIERALANNLDIKLERINPSIESWGVVRQQAAYDPILSGQVNYEDSTQPLNPQNATALGITSLKSKQLVSDAGLSGKLPPGTQYGLTYSDARFSGTIASNFVYTGTAALSLSQPILRNFGFGANSALIRVARKSRDIAVQNFTLQVMTTIRDVSTAYYELVFAIEDHKAKLEDLTLAQQLLDETRRRVQVGVSSPLDVTQAEAGVAAREQALILAERLIKDNENKLKRLISQNVGEFQGQSFVPADYPVVEMVETDTTQSIRTALQVRPDYVAAKQFVEQQNILVKYNRNQLWPEVDLQGSYGYNARGDNGFSSYNDNLARGDNPVWTVGVTASFPLGNRQARANYRVARLNAETALLNLKKLEQQIIVDVDNAVGHVQTNLKSVEAARASNRLARESLDAEKKKLIAGASTTFLVLQAQSQLATAQSAEIRARADYSESLVTLWHTDGTTLQKHNIVLDENF